MRWVVNRCQGQLSLQGNFLGAETHKTQCQACCPLQCLNPEICNVSSATLEPHQLMHLRTPAGRWLTEAWQADSGPQAAARPCSATALLSDSCQLNHLLCRSAAISHADKQGPGEYPRSHHWVLDNAACSRALGKEPALGVFLNHIRKIRTE